MSNSLHNSFRSFLVRRLIFLRRTRDDLELFGNSLFERSEKGDANETRSDVQMALSDLNWTKISLDRTILSLTKAYERIRKDGQGASNDSDQRPRETS